MRLASRRLGNCTHEATNMQSIAPAKSPVMHQYTANDVTGYNGDKIHWKLCHSIARVQQVQPHFLPLPLVAIPVLPV